jgi:hypothetical protein
MRCLNRAQLKTVPAAFLYICCFAALSFSCASTKPIEPPKPVTASEPPLLTEIPTISYVGAGIKYEFESMYLYHFLVLPDSTASGQYCTQLLDEASTAQVRIKFPSGTYECLVSEKAYDNDHAPFYVFLDDMPYRVYPSNPPLGSWELTTRVPIYFTIEEPRTILVTVQANSPKKNGGTGMNLDFIQFIKRQ